MEIDMTIYRVPEDQGPLSGREREILEGRDLQKDGGSMGRIKPLHPLPCRTTQRRTEAAPFGLACRFAQAGQVLRPAPVLMLLPLRRARSRANAP